MPLGRANGPSTQTERLYGPVPPAASTPRDAASGAVPLGGDPVAVTTSDGGPPDPEGTTESQSPATATMTVEFGGVGNPTAAEAK